MAEAAIESPSANGLPVTNGDESIGATQEDQKPILPKLSARDFRAYNRLAERMEYFHNHFRQMWKILYEAAAAGRRPPGLSVMGYIRTGEQLCSQIDRHHSIEEAYVFPMLGERMPAFRDELQLLGQHKQIMAGLGKLEEYLTSCRRGERELRLTEVKLILDGFGDVLWAHLNDEVKQLGAENMRSFWTLEEMDTIMPM